MYSACTLFALLLMVTKTANISWSTLVLVPGDWACIFAWAHCQENRDLHLVFPWMCHQPIFLKSTSTTKMEQKQRLSPKKPKKQYFCWNTVVHKSHPNNSLLQESLAQTESLLLVWSPKIITHFSGYKPIFTNEQAKREFF